MNVVYLLSAILLYITTLFIKKDNNKYNFVIFSTFLIGIFYFFNILLISILSLINIPTNFIMLSIINCLFISGVIIYSYKKNNSKIKIQKLEYNWKEVLSVIVIIIICLTIGIIRFNNFNNISYETTDPAVHYKTALKFSENMELLTKDNSIDELYKDFNHTIPGFSLNCGILINILSFIPSYKVYMLFDILILCLIATTFYATCLKIKKSKNSYIFTFIITCLYFGGYALNNLIFGFGYLGTGILATNLIIFTWMIIEDKNTKTKKYIHYSLLFLFNFSLFFSYYLFMPTVYLSQGIYLIYKWLKKEYNFKEILKIGIITLIIPFIIGLIYFIIPGFFSTTSDSAMSSAIALEGYIYRDLCSNYILILPLVIFSIIKEFKNKKISFTTFMIVIESLYIIITFILGLKGYISSYYYFKAYYIYWLFNYIYIIKLINYENKESEIIFKIYISYIALIVMICLLNIEQKIQEKNILFNNAIVFPNYANIYYFNAVKTVDDNPILTKNELEIINETIKNKSECINNQEIPVIGNYLQKLWFYSISDIVPIYNHESGNLSQFYETNFNYQPWLNDYDSKCLIIFNSENNQNSENYIYIDYDSYEILYKNESGSIIKKQIN